MSTSEGGPRPKRKDLPKNQRGVALAWKHGYRMSSGNMKTDGHDVWSWSLRIGRTVDGKKVAEDYRGSVSGSTTHHCEEVAAVADRTEPGCRRVERAL